MRNIASYYLHNMGFKDLWFMDSLVSCVSPVTNDPVHTVLGAGNGSGKSTTIAFLFSLLEPRRDRFLRTQKDSSFSFEDYLDRRYCQPGFVVIEFDAGPARSLFEGHRERIVVGQAACLSHSNSDYLYRRFFAFRAHGNLRMQTLLEGGEGVKPLKNIGSQAEFKEWLKVMRARAPKNESSNFFDTDNQDDWLVHLEGRGIDKLLTKLQWRYNRCEGGVEVKEANAFADHRDFLRRFIDMCLNESAALALKKNIESNIQSLADIPKYEKQLAVFRALLNGFEPFKLAAKSLQEAKRGRDVELQNARGLLLALQREIDSLSVNQQTHESSAKEFGIKAENAGTKLVKAEEQMRGLEKAFNEAKVRDADYAYQIALSSNQRAKDKLSIRKARKALKELDAYTSEIRELKQQLGIENEEIKVFLERAEDAGARFKSALTNNRNALEVLKTQSEKIAEAQEKTVAAELSKQQSILDREAQSIVKRIASIGALQEQANTICQRLIEDGILLSDESAHEALKRLEIEYEKLKNEWAVAEGAVKAIENQIEALREEYASKDKEHDGLKRKAKEQGREISRAQGVVGELLKDLYESGLIDTLEADLESDLVMRSIEDRRTQLETDAASLAIENGTLKNDKTCIERFKVLGVDHNVTSVIRTLTDIGVEAMPFGAYLAGVFADAPEVARNIYLTDPARFSGVQVIDSDSLKKAKELEGLNLDRPVLISQAPEDISSLASCDSVVVEHDGHALYNQQAAKVYYGELDGRVSELNQKQGRVSRESMRVAELKSRLNTFIKEFGHGKLQALKNKKEKTLRQAGELGDWLAQANEQLETLASELPEAEAKSKALLGKRQAVGGFCNRISDYIKDFDSKQQKWNEELSHLLQNQTRVNGRSKQLEKWKVRAAKNHLKFSNMVVRWEGEILRLKSLLSNVAHDSGKQYDVGSDYGALQKVYENAAQALNVKQSGKAIDLEGTLQTKRDERQKRLDEYEQKYEKFDEEAVRAVPIEGIDPSISEAEAVVAQADKDLTETKSLLDGLTGAHRAALSRWETADLVVADADIDASLSPETIQGLIRELSDNMEGFVSAKKDAERCARGQEELAKQALQDRVKYLGAHAQVKGAAEQLADLQVVPCHADVPSLEMVESTSKSQQARLNTYITNVSSCEREAENKLRSFLRLLESDDIREVAPYECSLMRQAGITNFEAFVADANDKDRIFIDRIKMLEDNINREDDSLNRCSKALAGGVKQGLRLLRQAVNFTVPESVAFLGGQHVLMISNLDKMTNSQMPMDEHLKSFIKRLATSEEVISSGHRLVADAISYVARQMAVTLKVQILKPIPALGRFDHVDISSYSSSSGGEGLTSALMYYLLAAHIRGKERGKNVNMGGALILDNPIGEANLPMLLQAQREIATQLDIQLLYYTGIKDLEALQEFDHHVTLRPSKQGDTKSGRRYMEIWDSEIQPAAREVPVEV